MLKLSKKDYKKVTEKWRDDPVMFINDNWALEPKLWPKLEEICYSVRDNRFTVIPSGHGVGKSFIAAKIVLWWLLYHDPSKVITTAPTWTQVETVLWGEIRASIANSRFPLIEPKNVLNTEIKLGPDHFALGISTTESVSQREFGSSKMQGFHSPHLLIVMDEAAGVDRSIHTAIKTLVSGEHNRVLMIGNPTSPSGPFYESCMSGSAKKITISCLDHPNVIQGKEVIPGAVTLQWLEDRQKEWGKESPLWKAKVLGEFPDETEDTIIPLSWCITATRAQVEPNQFRVLGIDPARYGDDHSVGYSVANNIASLVFNTSKEDTMMLSGRLVNIQDNYDLIYIDGTGVGGGVVDRTREVLNSALDDSKKKGSKVVEIHNGSKANNPERFFNLVSEMYWNLRERLRPDGEDWMKLKLPDDDELHNQLSGRKYFFSSNGRIQLESKDDYKKRTGKSPDKADALVLAAWAARPVKPETAHVSKEWKEYKQFTRKAIATNLSARLG
jgi:hypothetical protein